MKAREEASWCLCCLFRAVGSNSNFPQRTNEVCLQNRPVWLGISHHLLSMGVEKRGPENLRSHEESQRSLSMNLEVLEINFFF